MEWAALEHNESSNSRGFQAKAEHPGVQGDSQVRNLCLPLTNLA